MTEEKRRNKYLETDEIIREAYNDYARRFDRRPTQAQIASICGIHRKTVYLHMQGNRFFEGSGLKKAVKTRVEKEGKKEKNVAHSYKKSNLGIQTLQIMALLPKRKEDAQSARDFSELHNEYLYASVASSTSRLYRAGEIQRTESHPYRYWREPRKPCKLSKISGPQEVIRIFPARIEEKQEARIATLEADIAHIKEQYTELKKKFDEKKIDAQLKKLEGMRDIEQAKYDALEKEFKTWNDQETKIRRDVLK